MGSLRIRLSPQGKKGQRSYQIVVQDSKRALSSNKKVVIGHYNLEGKKDIRLDIEQYDKYIKNGAQPSNTVHELYKQKKNA